MRIIKIPKWFIILVVCFFLTVIVLFSYLQSVRFQLINEYTSKGNTIASILLFSPEIIAALAILI